MLFAFFVIYSRIDWWEYLLQVKRASFPPKPLSPFPLSHLSLLFPPFLFAFSDSFFIFSSFLSFFLSFFSHFYTLKHRVSDSSYFTVCLFLMKSVANRTGGQHFTKATRKRVETLTTRIVAALCTHIHECKYVQHIHAHIYMYNEGELCKSIYTSLHTIGVYWCVYNSRIATTMTMTTTE